MGWITRLLVAVASEVASETQEYMERKRLEKKRLKEEENNPEGPPDVSRN